VAAQDRVEISGLAHPNILLAGITWHVEESILPEDVINEA